MAENERQPSTWDLLRSILSILAVLGAGAASLSARLVVERSDAKDTDLERRIAVLEMQVAIGILPRTDERLNQYRRDLERLERQVDELEHQ